MMGASTPSCVGLILEKIMSKDKDFRYMAFSDLQRELQNNTFKVDDVMEKRLCDIILEGLEDHSGDITEMATKCLTFMTQRANPLNTAHLLKMLCEKLLGGKESSREIMCIALKTIISEIRVTYVKAFYGSVVTPTLLEGLKTEEMCYTLTATLEIIVESIIKFGEHYKDDVKVSTRDALLPLLSDSRTGLRKKAMQGIAGLAVHLNDEQLATVYHTLFSGLQNTATKRDVLAIYIQTLSAISKSIGWRFGPQLPVAAPIVMGYCERANDDDDLRENCLQALEAFISMSSSASKPFLERVLELVLAGIQHDPNLADDMSADGSGEEDDDDLSEDNYSDDEDLSWKVRRGAAKCLSAIIIAYPELLISIYPRVCYLLVQRFKEREENVKTDVFQTMIDLLQTVGIAARRFSGDEAGAGPLRMLQNDVSAIIAAAARQLRDKSVKTKSGVFQVLKELVLVLAGTQWMTADFVKQLLPGICSALQETTANSSGLKIQTLQFLRMSMEHSLPEVWQPYLPTLAPLLQATVGERYYKVTAEALRVDEQVVAVMRPDPTTPLAVPLRALVSPLFSVAASRVQAQDQDQEVKECAMMAACRAVALLGDGLGPDVPPFLQIVLERIRNEITRLVAVKGLTLILESPLKLPLQLLIQPVTEHLTTFLRKFYRPLRYAALHAIQAIIVNHSALVPEHCLQQLVLEIAPLVNDQDLVLATLGLNLCCLLLHARPDAAPSIARAMLVPAVDLAKSAVTQGNALEAVHTMFTSLMKTGIPEAQFEVLLHALVQPGRSPDISKAGQLSLASCIAAICKASGPQQMSKTVNQLLTELQKPMQDEVTYRLTLLTLGEIGRVTDLSTYPGAQAALTAALSSPSEEVKAAASTALGAVTFGNVDVYLPFLLAKITAETTDKYLLLKALNESIIQLAHSKDGASRLNAKHQKQVLELLLDTLKGDNDEAPSIHDAQCRNVGAECLGHLALLHPPLVNTLQKHATTSNPYMRMYVVKAVKALFVAGPHPVDPLLVTVLPVFLSYLDDDSRHVRKAVVELLNAAAHNKPSLVVEHLQQTLPLLYAQTVIDESLIREVDLGPFKHKIDDGLELRKAAFECMDVVLESCPDNVDYNEFMGPLSSGLSDHYDIRMGCHLLLSKLATRVGPVVLANLGPLVPHLEATLVNKLKADAVKQETDRNEDLVRSCLRAIDILQCIPNSDACGPFRNLMINVVMKFSASKFEAVQKERIESEGKQAAD